MFIFFPLLLAACRGDAEKDPLTRLNERLGKGTKEERIVPVKTMQVDTVSEIVTHTYAGTVEESRSVELSFKYGGVLEQIKVREGDPIEKGGFLAKVNASELVNSQRIAAATLEQAEDGYNRLKKVHESGSIPEIKWKEMVANLEKAQASADLANDMINESMMRAPFSGVVAKRYVEEGANLSPLQPIVRLINTNGVSVKIAVPENEISRIKIGDEAEVVVTALDDKLYRGKVVEKGMVAAPLAHSYDVKIALDNEDGALFPGMIGKVSLQSELSKGIVIPSNIVLLDDNSKFVWVVEQGRAHKRHIEVNGYSGKGVVVMDGLHQGDSVIVEGYQKVSGNMKVVSYGK